MNFQEIIAPELPSFIGINGVIDRKTFVKNTEFGE
jgi:hypothetical protein